MAGGGGRGGKGGTGRPGKRWGSWQDSEMSSPFQALPFGPSPLRSNSPSHVANRPPASPPPLPARDPKKAGGEEASGPLRVPHGRAMALRRPSGSRTPPKPLGPPCSRRGGSAASLRPFLRLQVAARRGGELEREPARRPSAPRPRRSLVPAADAPPSFPPVRRRRAQPGRTEPRPGLRHRDPKEVSAPGGSGGAWTARGRRRGPPTFSKAGPAPSWDRRFQIQSRIKASVGSGEGEGPGGRSLSFQGTN